MSIVQAHTVLLLCLTWVTVAAAQPSPADQDLLRGHLEQAAGLVPHANQPGADTALQSLQADIAARRQAWSEALEHNVEAAALLTGLAPQTLAQAQRLAPDTAAVQAVPQSNLPRSA